MANNYTQATVYPELSKTLFTEQDLETLQENGFSFDEAHGDELYFYVEEGFDEDETAHIFQKAIERSKNSDEVDPVEEILIEGAFTCSKMRPGEFGGFVLRITEDNVQGGGTGLLIDMFRQGVL